MYMTVTGAKQGKFKGSDGTSRLEVLQFNWQISQPINVPKSPTGSAPVKPKIVGQPNTAWITKYMGADSPQFLNAATSREVLKTVFLEFLDDQLDKERVTSTLTLTNCTIESLRNRSFTRQGSETEVYLQDVTFTFEEEEYQAPVKKTTDDWR
jgi:type VI secretion system Hcp family effector